MQSNPSQEKALSGPLMETSPIRLEIDYDSEVSNSLFRAKGSLVLWGRILMSVKGMPMSWKVSSLRQLAHLRIPSNPQR
jgi:hypothetical protein